MSDKRAGRGFNPPSLVNIQQPNLTDIISMIADKAEPLIKLLTSTMDKYQAGQQSKANLQKHMAWVAVSVVFFVIIVAGLLTYREKIDGSTFTFLLGLIVGYVLTFVRDQITGPDSR